MKKFQPLRKGPSRPRPAPRPTKPLQSKFIQNSLEPTQLHDTLVEARPAPQPVAPPSEARAPPVRAPPPSAGDPSDGEDAAGAPARAPPRPAVPPSAGDSSDDDEWDETEPPAAAPPARAPPARVPPPPSPSSSESESDSDSDDEAPASAAPPPAARASRPRPPPSPSSSSSGESDDEGPAAPPPARAPSPSPSSSWDSSDDDDDAAVAATPVARGLGAAACPRMPRVGDFLAHRHNDDAPLEAEKVLGRVTRVQVRGQTADIRCAWFNCDEATGHLEVRRRSFGARWRFASVGEAAREAARAAEACDAAKALALEDVVCQVCGSGDDEAQLVLCDDCDAGAAHTYCLELGAVPDAWRCDACARPAAPKRRPAPKKKRARPAPADDDADLVCAPKRRPPVAADAARAKTMPRWPVVGDRLLQRHNDVDPLEAEHVLCVVKKAPPGGAAAKKRDFDVAFENCERKRGTLCLAAAAYAVNWRFATEADVERQLGALVDEACGVCGRRDDEASLVLCDGCEAGAAHTYCLGLDGVPEGDWFCAACASQRGSTGTRKTSVSV